MTNLPASCYLLFRDICADFFSSVLITLINIFWHGMHPGEITGAVLSVFLQLLVLFEAFQASLLNI